MHSSAARIAANRANSLKSCGPKTIEGKERSRRNGLKQGLTGQGIVIPEGDFAEVDRRAAALQAEMAPRSEVGEILVRQIATLSVRMERGARQEFASVAARVRHAADEFDEERVGRAKALLEAIGQDPKGNLRRLRKSPEGVALLIEAWRELRGGLTRELKPAWTSAELVRMANMLGIRAEDAGTMTIGALTRATWGNFGGLTDLEGGQLGDEARKAWARGRLSERIDEAVAELEEHRETLDFEAIEQDRAEAGTRALFDPSREATLARRYESEARRGFFRALQEFRKAEDEFERAEVENERAEPTAGPPANPSRASHPAPLASSCQGSRPSPRVLPPASPRDSRPAVSASDSVPTGVDGQVLTIGRPAPGRG